MNCWWKWPEEGAGASDKLRSLVGKKRSNMDTRPALRDRCMQVGDAEVKGLKGTQGRGCLGFVAF